MEGWVKLWTRLKEWEYKKNPNMMALWVHILISADWQGKTRGELVTSIRELSGETGLSVQQVRTGLDKLLKSKQIEIDVIDVTQQATQQATQSHRFGIAQRATKITICKYEQYQGKQKLNNTVHETMDNTTSNTVSHTPSFIISEENTDGASARARVKSLDERREKFREEVMSFSSAYEERMLEGFFNYWSEASRDGKRMRMEMEKTWELKRRLSTWDRNNVEKGRPSSRKDKKREDASKYSAANVLGAEYREWIKTKKGQIVDELFK